MWDVIEHFIGRRSGWRFTGASGFNIGLALGVGHEELTLERNAHRLRLSYSSIQGGFSIADSAFGGSSPSMNSAEVLNQVFYNPMYYNDDIPAEDFTGGARSVSIGATVGIGESIGMYVFGSAALAISSLITPVPHASLYSALKLANAIGFVDSNAAGSLDVGVTFGIGNVEFFT